MNAHSRAWSVSTASSRAHRIRSDIIPVTYSTRASYAAARRRDRDVNLDHGIDSPRRAAKLGFELSLMNDVLFPDMVPSLDVAPGWGG